MWQVRKFGVDEGVRRFAAEYRKSYFTFWNKLNAGIIVYDINVHHGSYWHGYYKTAKILEVQNNKNIVSASIQELHLQKRNVVKSLYAKNL